MGAAYVIWAVFDIAKLALVGLVVADALVDFRGRWARGAAGARPRRRDDRDHQPR